MFEMLTGAQLKMLLVAENFVLATTCQCFRLPGDSRTKIGFITFDSTIHFYNLQEGLSQPQMLIVSDIEGKANSDCLQLNAWMS